MPTLPLDDMDLQDFNMDKAEYENAQLAEHEPDGPPRLSTPVRGRRVRVLRLRTGCGYTLDGVYVVASEVPCRQGLVRLADPETGIVGGHLHAADIRSAAALDWSWLQGHLPPRDRRLLEAFEGLESLTLKASVRDRLIATLPNLRAAILAARE